jgi:hypothetical protein
MATFHRRLRDVIADRLVEIERLLPPASYRLTLVARHLTMPTAHVIVSADTFADIRRALDALEHDPRAVEVPAATQPTAEGRTP